jgi:hypothetical protein
MLTEQMPTKFQVKINGIPYGQPQPTRMLAEMVLMNLTPDQRMLAEVVPVSQAGQQLLLG